MTATYRELAILYRPTLRVRLHLNDYSALKCLLSGFPIYFVRYKKYLRSLTETYILPTKPFQKLSENLESPF